MGNIRNKKETAKKWLDLVFDNLDNLEREIIFNIEHSSFNEESLNKQLSKLQMHYSAISNLKKSFADNSYFVGYID